jgi:transposase
MYPLITNDRGKSPAQVLEAHKGQPMIEKRFEQIKTVHEIAPVLLKNEGRIEALRPLFSRAPRAGDHRARAAPFHEA